MLLTLLLLIVALVVFYYLFVGFYPSFGGDVSKDRQDSYRMSAQFNQGTFVNSNPVKLDMSFGQMLSISRKVFFQKTENGRPAQDIKPVKIDSTDLADYASPTRLFWFGHSSFLIQMNDKNILIDPMFSAVPAPHTLLGSKRFNSEMPIEVQQLPNLDVVLISHDHYDHLDYRTIKALKDKVNQFYTPLGVGVHLEAWGVAKEKIKELDWWQETSLDDMTFICAPARHFSGRKMNNRQSTLWGSWILQSATENIFFSGDSGYDTHFKEIGEKYGPFDFAMLECGQYNTMWPDVHMFPEETAQAGIDLKAAKIMPIHWGAFKLAMHSWTDPVERVTKKANELNVPVITPQIGEEIILNEETARSIAWWE